MLGQFPEFAGRFDSFECHANAFFDGEFAKTLHQSTVRCG